MHRIFFHPTKEPTRREKGAKKGREREQTISYLKSRDIVRPDAKGAGAEAPVDFENAHMNSSISRNFKDKKDTKVM